MYVTYVHIYQSVKKCCLKCKIMHSLQSFKTRPMNRSVDGTKCFMTPIPCYTLQWCHNGLDSISNHQPHDCLLKRLFRRRSKKTSKLRDTGLCVENSPETGEFPHKGPVTRKMFPFDDVIMNYGYGGILFCSGHISGNTVMSFPGWESPISIHWTVIQ